MAADQHKRLFLRDPRNMERFKPGVSPPRLNFAGFIDFRFSDEVRETLFDGTDDSRFREQISSLLQTASLPSVAFQTSIKNQYNIKRIVNTAVEYQPIQITVLDSLNNDWLLLLMRYFSYLYMNPRNKTTLEFRDPNPSGYQTPDEVITNVSNFMKPGFNSNAAGLDLTRNSNFFDWIKLVVIHAGRGTEYVIFKPKLTEFSFGEIDFTSSDARKFNMSFEYENFTINKRVNFSLSEEDLMRFENLGEAISWAFDDGDQEKAQNNPIFHSEFGALVTFTGDSNEPSNIPRLFQPLSEDQAVDTANAGNTNDPTDTGAMGEETPEDMPVEDEATKTKKGSKFRALVGAAVGAATAAATGGNPLTGAAAGAAAGAVTGGGLGAAAKNAAGAAAVAGAISGNDAKAIAEAAAIQAASTLITGAIGRATGGGNNNDDDGDSGDDGDSDG